MNEHTFWSSGIAARASGSGGLPDGGRVSSPGG